MREMTWQATDDPGLQEKMRPVAEQSDRYKAIASSSVLPNHPQVLQPQPLNHALADAPHLQTPTLDMPTTSVPRH
jgi:hypothetical protein